MDRRDQDAGQYRGTVSSEACEYHATTGYRSPLWTAIMTGTETTTHSFIVTVWLEEKPTGRGDILWRGRITHVPSGANRYFQDLSGIGSFIEPYLPCPDDDSGRNNGHVDHET